MCLHINHKIAILHIKRYIVAGSSRAMYMSPFLLWRRTVGQRTVGRSTVGQRTVGRRTVGRRTLWRRTLGRLSNRDGWTLWRKRWLYSSIIMGKRVMTNCDFRHWRHFVANGDASIVANGAPYRHCRHCWSKMATINGDAIFKIATKSSWRQWRSIGDNGDNGANGS